MVEEDEDRLRVRRGSEHVRIKGTTEELGEIVPPPVTAGVAPDVEEEEDVTVAGEEREESAEARRGR